MSTTDLMPAVSGERRDLAAMLASLTLPSWDAPTLCEGWRVREVVAHMTMPYRYSEQQFWDALGEADGDFDQMADTCARRDAAELLAEELVTWLRDNVDHPWQPPGGGLEGALSHDVIHGLDITVALGIDRKVPEDRIQVVLSALDPTSGGFFGVDLDGIRLRANDLPWALGSGAPLEGRAQDLLLVIAGRQLPHGRLAGEPSARFTAS